MVCVVGCCDAVCAPGLILAGASFAFAQRDRLIRFLKGNWLKFLIFVVIPIVAAYAALHLGYVEAPQVDYKSIPYVDDVLKMTGFSKEDNAPAVVDVEPAEPVVAAPPMETTDKPAGGCGCCSHSKP